MQVLQADLKFTQPLTPLTIKNIQYIVVHHAEAVTATPEEIHQWHLDNGWSGFGYNEYIRKDGTVYIGRGDNVGAQCLGYNSTSYGICCEGDYDKEQNMPEAQFESLVARLKYHSGRFPGAKIVGHKELYNTACPGQYFPLKKVLTAEKADPLDDALDCLVANAIISDKGYWKDKAMSVQYLDVVFKNTANKIKSLKGEK